MSFADVFFALASATGLLGLAALLAAAVLAHVTDLTDRDLVVPADEVLR